MKKIICILGCLVALPAMADEWYEGYRYDSRPQYDTYIGLRIHQNKHLAMKYDVTGGLNTTIKDDSMGIGLNIGNRLTNHVKLEFETSYTGGQDNKYDTDFEFDIWSNMLNMYLYQEFDGAVETYAGLGVGIASKWGDVTNAHAKMSDTSTDLSWAAMLGVNFALNSRLDLNVGVKYQNYGDIKHISNDKTYATTKIDATEIYIGAAYKFGLGL